MNTFYGHQHLIFFFIKRFECAEDGIIFRGKKYVWNDITKISRCSGSLSINLCYPGAEIHFNDGKKIRINGRVFTKKGERPKFNIFSFVTGESKTFTEFLDEITKIKKGEP
jgi:hypothetical protein